MAKKKSLKYYLHYLYILSDILFIFAVSLITFYSYYGRDGFVKHLNPIMIYSASLAAFSVIAFAIAKIYRMFTSEIGLFEMIRILSVTFITQMVGYVTIAVVRELPEIRYFTLSFVLGLSMTTLVICLSRVFIRVFFILRNMRKKKEKVRTLIIGAGSAGKIVIDESRKNPDNHNVVVAFVDDDINKIGGTFANLPVKGPINQISTIIDYYKIEEVIIAISELSHERLHEILSLLDLCPVRVRRLPTLSEMEGPNDKRIIDVDLNDILSRDVVILDNHEVNEVLRGKSVLITGAGGSIGSELTRQIFKTHPKTLILFDIYENSTYDIQMELVKKMRDEDIKDINLVVLIGSTYNEVRMEQIFKKYKPDFVYHAAAYKHVPLMEDSPAEAIRTNVIGTYNVAKLCDKYHVTKMVLVSTDKAVRPTNVMGATKRFAETIIQYYAKHSKTKYAAVRFGNVLGSNGSVVPLFKKQIEAGGPVTLTHKDIVRYFMTIPEAVSLILQCGLFAEGGEIFILDMGQPVKIYHLAERLIRQAGYVPGRDIKIIETGLRPGEKLFEELLLDKSVQTPTKNRKIYIEPTEMVNEKVLEDVERASAAFGLEETTNDVKKLLETLISTYKSVDNNGK